MNKFIGREEAKIILAEYPFNQNHLKMVCIWSSIPLNKTI